MNIKTIFHSGGTLFKGLQKYISVMNFKNVKSTCSSISSWPAGIIKPPELKSLTLTPQNFFIIPSCGMKAKAKLVLRCKDCYFTRKDGETYVLCSSYPRHKQQAKTKKEKLRWILTHAAQSKLRPY